MTTDPRAILRTTLEQMDALLKEQEEQPYLAFQPGYPILTAARTLAEAARGVLDTPPASEPQDDVDDFCDRHTLAMGVAYDDANEWGPETEGYKANLLAERIEELMILWAKRKVAERATPPADRWQPQDKEVNEDDQSRVDSQRSPRPTGSTASKGEGL